MEFSTTDVSERFLSNKTNPDFIYAFSMLKIKVTAGGEILEAWILKGA